MIEENQSSRDLEQLFGSRLKEKEKQMKFADVSLFGQA